jgi:dienelactone hydrolase
VKRPACLFLLCLSPILAQESRDQLLRHWDYDKIAPLNVKQSEIRNDQGVKVYDLTYSSPVADRAHFVGPNGGTVTSYLVAPPGRGPFAAVIYGHWCMDGSEKKNRKEFLDEAIVLAHSGVVSLLPDHVIVHPGFVEDKTPLNEQQIFVEVQQDVNLRRGADILLARKDVDPARLAYVGHSCDATAGGFLSGIDKRFKAFVIMAGDLSDQVDSTTPRFQEHRKKIGPARFDAFIAKFAWTDTGKYASHAAPAAMFLQYATDEPFLNGDMAKRYFEVVSQPKKLKIYQAQHALNAEATRDRIAFLAEQLSFPAPDPKAVAAIPVLFQPPWPQR